MEPNVFQINHAFKTLHRVFESVDFVRATTRVQRQNLFGIIVGTTMYTAKVVMVDGDVVGIEFGYMIGGHQMPTRRCRLDADLVNEFRDFAKPEGV